METLAFAEENKHNETLIDEILEKARRERASPTGTPPSLLDCDIEEKNQEIYRLAEQIKKTSTATALSCLPLSICPTTASTAAPTAPTT